MNEPKPEDVMRALEICAEYESDPCPEHCPLYEEDICNMPIFLNILREKDARIKELEEAVGAEFTCFVGDPHKVDRCPYADALAEKDAEIERLNINMNAYGLTAKYLAKEFEDYRADVQMEIADARAEAITGFAKKLKEAVKYIPWCEYPPVHQCIDQIAKEMKEVQT